MAFQLSIAAVASRGRLTTFAGALEIFSARLAPYVPAHFPVFETEEALLEALHRQRGRLPTFLVLLDSQGKTYSSEGFAAWLRRERDGGRQSMMFAVGPASGWSDEAKAHADLLLSLGPMTLPHELARVVLTEQVYRAFTIIAGHPYHLGH